MPGRAKSDSRKNREKRQVYETLIARAVNGYQNQTPAAGQKRKGFRKITEAVNEEYLALTGNHSDLKWETVKNRYNGVRSLTEARAEDQGWLTELETVHLCDFLTSCAEMGLPCNRRRVREAANTIIRVRDTDFPGVGQNWVHRWLERMMSQKRLASYWSRALETKRGKAVNPYTHEQWFSVLERVCDEYQFDSDCIYNSDESGFQKGVAEREHVYGAPGAHVQHQQREVDRENTTAMITICADGTFIAPAIIFKGKYFQTKWAAQDDPLGCS